MIQNAEKPPASKVTKQEMVFHPRRRTPRSGPTCIDLFSGAGGLAEGFRQAGWSIVSANDLDSFAADTFMLNFPEASFFHGPIARLDATVMLRDAGLRRGQLACLIGGPPCQSFSYNNHQRTASDKRARLFNKYLQIVEALRPKTLLMENVPGMLTIGDGSIVDKIKRKLGAIGYKCEVRILYAEDFGVPQTRRRAFIIGTRIGSATHLFPNGTCGPSEKPSEENNQFAHRWQPPSGRQARPFVTVGDAIGDLPQRRKGGGEDIIDYRSEPKSDYQRHARRSIVKLHNHVSHKLTKGMLVRIRHVPEGGNWLDIPRRLLPAGMQRARLSDHTKRYGRLRRKGLASTILTKCDPHWGAYVHPTQNRTITVREAARIQGFPDKFRFAGSYLTAQYTQVGNAVPVPVAKALGRSLKRHVLEWAKVKRGAIARPRLVLKDGRYVSPIPLTSLIAS